MFTQLKFKTLRGTEYYNKGDFKTLGQSPNIVRIDGPMDEKIMSTLHNVMRNFAKPTI